MARPIINADEHLKALSSKSQKCISAAMQLVKAVHPTRVHLHKQDVERISKELKDSGFDLGRGFKVCGIRVVGVQS
jgi:hypothetical protein